MPVGAATCRGLRIYIDNTNNSSEKMVTNSIVHRLVLYFGAFEYHGGPQTL